MVSVFRKLVFSILKLYKNSLYGKNTTLILILSEHCRQGPFQNGNATQLCP